MRLHKLIISSILFVSCIGSASAQEPTTIINHITEGNNNTVSQPDSLLQRLVPIEGYSDDNDRRPTSTKTAGYRIQIFSDNNPRTAKSNARSRARDIESQFPQYRTYVTYNSPFWRLRVGDFRIQQDAVHAAEEIKKAFPAYSREIRVVRDRINASL